MRVTKKLINEVLETYFPDDYYDHQRKQTLKLLWKHFTFKYKNNGKPTKRSKK